jgi:hypothetical protein
VGRAADRLNRVGDRLRTLPDEGVDFATKTVRASVLQALREDAGSDRRLSGIRNGVPQTVKVTRRETGQLVVGRIMAGPRSQRAPWFWLEEGTRAGRRGPPVGRYASARSNRGWHPGSPAMRTWSRGVGMVSVEVRDEFERLFRKAVRG